MSSQRRSEETPVDPTPLVDTQAVLVRAQSVFGRKWSPVLLHRLLVDGPMGFNELQRSVPDISGKMLSESLEHLEDLDVVDRRVVSDRPVRVEYAPTERGAALAPTITTLVQWGREYVPEAERDVVRPSKR